MLKNLRQEISDIDEKLIVLLAKRMQISEAIGEYKKEQGLPITDEGRWQKALAKRVKLGRSHGLNKNAVEKIWHAIHEFSLKAQQ